MEKEEGGESAMMVDRKETEAPSPEELENRLKLLEKKLASFCEQSGSARRPP